MTTLEDRVAVLQALWASLERLVPAKTRPAFDGLYVAIEATYNAHGEARAAEAYHKGRTAAEATISRAREAGFRAGMLAVQKRSDFRDLDWIEDPEELRSTH